MKGSGIMRLMAVLTILWPGNLLCPAADLSAILDKHLNALGDRDSLIAVTAAAVYHSVEYMGLTGTSMTCIKLPAKYLIHLDLGNFVQEKGFDGITAWTTDQNGMTRRDIPEELKPLINELYVQSYSYVLPGRNPGRVEYRGDTVIDGVTYHRLTMYPEGGDSVTVFINAATGRLERRRETITGMMVETRYSDFRVVGGVELPFAEEMETPGTAIRMSARLDSVRINPDLPDTVFLMPGAPVIDYRFPSHADSVSVPFDFPGSQLLVPVRVNGRGPFRFLLDSGAGGIILASRVADNLGIEAAGEVPVRGIGGLGNLAWGKIDSLGIGQLSWEITRISIFDFTQLAGGSLSDLDGILGYDFFMRFPVRIDFDSERLTVYDPRAAHPERTGESMALDIYCQVPIARAEIDGVPVRVAVDLGAQPGLVVQHRSRWYRELKDSLEPPAVAVLQGVGGSHNVRLASRDSLRIGSIRIDHPEVLIAGEEFMEFPFPDYIEGFLGTGILRQFNLFIDYQEGRIYLDERKMTHE